MSSSPTLRKRLPHEPSLTTRSSTSSRIGQMHQQTKEAYSLETALDSQPQHHSIVHKLHKPILLQFLPQFLLSLLTWCCGIRPVTWKERHLVLLGSYLYRFDPATGKCKGSPLEVTSISASSVSTTAEIATDKALNEQQQHASSTTLLRISTFTKDYTFYCSGDDSKNTIQTWCHVIQQAQAETHRRELGHVTDAAAIPPRWRHWDAHGRSVAQHKLRVRRRNAEKQGSEWMAAPGIVGGGYLT